MTLTYDDATPIRFYTIEEPPTPTPTSTPTATEEGAPTATPSPTATVDLGEAPKAPENVNVAVNVGRPQVTWTDDANAQYYRIFIGNSDYSVVLQDEWYEKAAVCQSGQCSVQTEVYPLGGVNHVWMQAWGNSQFSVGGNTIADGWSNADFTMPTTPPGPIKPLTVTVAQGGDVTFSWEGSSQASWYNLWVGTSENADPSLRSFSMTGFVPMNWVA